MVRLTVVSRMVAPAVVRPQIDAWVLPDGRLEEPRVELAPAHTYLAQGAEARLALTASVPAGLSPGDRLQGGLRFPGTDDAALALDLEILPTAADGPAVEHEITIFLPLMGYEAAPQLEAAGAKSIATLLAGLAGMEVVPAKWLVAELLLTVCEVGADYAETHEGAALLDRLSRLRFFKNGVLAFRGAHLPNWGMIGVTVSSGLQSVFSGNETKGRMLYTWEKWLLDLIEIDLENAGDEGLEVLLPPPPELERSLSRLGTTAERWFGCLLLGLMKLSPRIRSVLERLAEEAPPPVTGDDEGPDEEPEDVLSEEGSIQR